MTRSGTISLWSRWRTILWLTLACIILQQLNYIGVHVPNTGIQATLLPLHLHAGLLLAIAILYRDRRIVAACYLLLLIAWYARRVYDFNLPWQGALAGLIAALLYIPWTYVCVSILGPRRYLALRSGFTASGLMRLVAVTLIAFPMGSAVISQGVYYLFGAGLWPNSEMNLRHALGKVFAGMMLTLPLVVAWSERNNMRLWRPNWPDLIWLVFVFILVTLSVVLKSIPFAGEVHVGMPLQFGQLDAAVIMIAVLGWAAVRLPAATSMAVMSALMLIIFMFSRNHWAESGWGSLLHLMAIVYELAAVQMVMMFLIVMVRDSRRASARLKAEANYDALTGLPNLRALREYFSQVETKAEPVPSHIGYLMMDQVGRAPGTHSLEVQAAVAKAVAACVSDLVRVYLVSADHYVLVPTGTASAEMWSTVTRRVESGEASVKQYAVQLLSYIGVTRVSSANTAALDAAFLSASALATEARAQGEMQPSISESAVNIGGDFTETSMTDTVEIFSSLRSGRLELYFQGIHSLYPERISKPGLAGEVLCRLRTSKGELLPPNRFVPLVEAAGRGAELDLAVVGAVLSLLREHKTSRTKFRDLGINLTGQGLASRGFHDRLWALLGRSPIPLSCFCFEVTETAAIRNMDAARELLQRLRAEGCRVAIDDFGTGLQNFARLKEFPVDVLKIDGSFVRNIALRGSDYALVQATVGIAQAFKVETVAEYVESEEVVEILRKLNVDSAQGYLFGEPLPLKDVLQMPQVAGDSREAM